MNPEQQKAAGNEAFKRRDYKDSVQLYTESLHGLGTAASLLADGTHEQPPASIAQLKLILLCNRSLAYHRLGSYAAAAEDAQTALQLQAAHSKAAFRLAAALLQLGDAASAVHAMHLPPAPQGSPREQLPAGWEVLKAHAASRLAHERRRAAPVAGAASSHVAQAQRVLALLEAEADGEAEGPEADPAALMQQLATLLTQPDGHDGSGVEVAACLAASLEAPGCPAYQLLLFHLASPTASCVEAAAAALKAAALAAAAGTSATLWPAIVWQRLLALATDCSGGSHGGMAAALQLLEWAAGRDSYVRHQLLLHPLPVAAGMGGGGSPLEQVLLALADSSRLHHMPPAAVAAAARLVRSYAGDAASTDALVAACRPLLPLLRAAAAAERMADFLPEADGSDRPTEAAVEAGQADGGSGLVRCSAGLAAGPANPAAQAAAPQTLEEAETQALLALRQKRQQVFNAQLVSLRRELLGAALELAANSRELVLREAVEERPGVGGAQRDGKRSVGAGAFLTELLAYVRQLHEQQPRRTSPVLGADGSAQAYEKRRFAADFKDNPLGDYLVSMDLADNGGLPAAAAGQEAQPSQQPALLELALQLLLRTAAASGTAAALLYRRKLFGLCQELSSYCTASVVTAALRLYAAAADAAQAAADELFGGKAVAPLAALFQFSTREPRRLRAADRLEAAADTCCGDDFALLTAAGDSAVCCAWGLLQGAEGGEQDKALQAVSQALLDSAQRLLLRCCDRAQRHQQLEAAMPPRGGAWAAIGSKTMKQLLKERHLKPAQPAPRPPADTATFDHLKKGFLARSPAAPHQASSSTAKPSTGPGDGGDTSATAAGSSSSTHTYKSGAVVIEELPADDEPAGPVDEDELAAVPTPQQQLREAPVRRAEASEGGNCGQGEQEGEDEEEGLPDLQDTFDSGRGLAAQQRRARADWMAVPLAKKVRWKQEGQEVSLFVAVPAGTVAADVQVSATYGHLTVGLKWFGRVVGGPLHSRVKEEEVHWCLEDGEVHMLLVKAEAGERWTALFDGRQEESYHSRLLREGVDLGDRAPRYDLLSDSARALIAAVEERQVYLKAGLIDARSTEDFVLIEN